jgi:hypothetical protein
MSATRSLFGGIDAWLSKPASLLDDWWRAVSPGRRTELVLSGDGVVVRVVSGARGVRASEEIILSGDGDGSAASDRRLADVATGRRVALHLPSSWVIERHLELPLQAASHLPGIVASRLNALSPLPRNEVLHGHRVTGTDRQAGRMNVALAIVPRSKVGGALAALARVSPREIELRAPLGGDQSITRVSGQGGSG